MSRGNLAKAPPAFFGYLRSSAWLICLTRVLVGSVFLLSGFSKILLPQAEVEVIIRQYQIIPEAVIPWIAALLPWLEIASGTALCIGFLTTLAAWLVTTQLLSFILLMLLVLMAGIAIEDCGCFGNLGLRETPLQVLFRDLILLALLIPVLARQRDAWSLDAWGNAQESIEDDRTID